MPMVTVVMFKGRTDAQKVALVRSVTDAVVESIDAKPEAVRILIQEIERHDTAVGGVLSSEN